MQQSILIVDDNKMDLSVFYELFQSEYQIFKANNRADALKKIREHSNFLTLIIVVLKTSSINGFDIILEMKQQHLIGHIPFVFLTENPHSHDLKKCFDLGASDVIDKPFEPYFIKQRVDNVIELFNHKNHLDRLLHQKEDHLFEIERKKENQTSTMNELTIKMIEVLSTTIEYRDCESGEHIQRIKLLSKSLLEMVARECPEYELTEDKIEMISLASTMHDIGKISIPDAILLKPERLTKQEFEIMKSHTVKGCEILQFLNKIEENEFIQYCYEICRYHHEKWDGKGYPEGLKGDEIPLSAQVVSIADCYDALISERAYKNSISHEQAVCMIRMGACGHFSPKLLRCFNLVQSEFKNLTVKYPVIPFKNYKREIAVNKKEKKKINYLQEHDSLSLLYQIYDVIFECDIKESSLKLHKGVEEWENIFSYIPINYCEAIAQCYSRCHIDYQERFSSVFMLDHLMKKFEKGERRVTCELRVVNPLGETLYLRCVALLIADQGENLSKILVFFLKLDEKNKEEEQKQFLLHHDELTGLFNKQFIEKNINEYLLHNGKSGNSVLIHLDVDNLRKLNELISHQFGDMVLKDISVILKELATQDTIIGRIHSDVFVIFIKDAYDIKMIIQQAEKLHKTLNRVYMMDKGEFTVSVSMGIVRYPEHGKNYKELYANAEYVTNQVKLDGKNMYVFYNDSMNKIKQSSQFYSNILKNEEENDYSPMFFPSIQSDSGKISSYECFSFINNKEEIPYQLKLYYESMIKSQERTRVGLNTLKRNIEFIYQAEKNGNIIPPLSLYVIFDAQDKDIFLRKLNEILEKNPVTRKNITIHLDHDMMNQMSERDIETLVYDLKALELHVGIYRVGSSNINVTCFKQNLFDKVVFSIDFIKKVFEEEYPFHSFIHLLDIFEKSGVQVAILDRLSERKCEMIKQKTNSNFSYIGNPIQDEVELFNCIKEHPYTLHEKKSLKNESNFHISEDRYNEIFEKSRTIIFEWRPKEDFFHCSNNFEQIYGYTPNIKGFTKWIECGDVVYLDDRKLYMDSLQQVRFESPYVEFSARVKKITDGIADYIWNKFNLIAIKDQLGITLRVIGYSTDIDKEKKETQYHKRKAETDFLTSLYNKGAIEKYISRFLNTQGKDGNHALFILDIDNFKKINDCLGHIFGDSILKDVAAHINRMSRDTDISGRVGGDEFVVFLKNISDEKHILQKAQEMCTSFRENNQTKKEKVSLSVGISIYPKHGKDYKELFAKADTALYSIKAKGKDGFEIFSEKS